MALSGLHEHALTDLSDVAVAAPNGGDVLRFDATAEKWTATTPAGSAGELVTANIIIGDGLHLIDVGPAGTVLIPFAGTVVAATLIAEQTGSIICDVQAGPLGNPLTLTSITGASPPTLANAQTSQDTTLAGWATGIAANSAIGVSVQSAALVKRVTLALTLRRN